MKGRSDEPAPGQPAASRAPPGRAGDGRLAVPPPAQLELETPRGLARAHVHAVSDARAALVLGHGAGGGVSAPDLSAARDAALERGVAVALVEQPYRVAGRRAPAPAVQLDESWRAVVERLGTSTLAGLELIAGGRSLGARVACRTAAQTGAAAVLCLAFPLRPPARRGGLPGESRIGELDAVNVPVLVVQGATDRFGMPPAAPGRRIVEVRGDHALRSDLPAVRAAVGSWIEEVLG